MTDSKQTGTPIFNGTERFHGLKKAATTATRVVASNPPHLLGERNPLLVQASSIHIPLHLHRVSSHLVSSAPLPPGPHRFKWSPVLRALYRTWYRVVAESPVRSGV